MGEGMIKPTCFFCKKELYDFGAILLSPPDQDKKCVKHHCCQLCYSKLIKFVEAEKWYKDNIEVLKRDLRISVESHNRDIEYYEKRETQK